MKKTKQSEFEYKPMQTELNYKNSEFSNNESSNQVDFSEFENEEIQKYEKSLYNNAAINNSKNNKLFNYNSLESLRVSHSMDKNDNSVTLYEGINGIKKDNIKNKNNDFEKFTTPIKKQKEIQKVELIPDVFNYSSTNNKNIQVSELDIQLNPTNENEKNKIPENNIKYNNNIVKDFKKELEKNLKEYFEKKCKLDNQNKFNTIETGIYTEFQKHKFKPFSNKEINRKKQKEYKSNSVITESSKNINSPTYKNIINSTNKPITKHKIIYNSVKKTNNKKGIYHIIQKINNDFKNSFTKSNSVKRNNSFKSKYDRNKESATSALTNCSSSKRLSKNSFNNNPIITTEFNLPNNNIPKSTRIKNIIPNKKIKIQKPICYYKDDSFYKRCPTDLYKGNISHRSTSQNGIRSKNLNISSASGRSNSKLSSVNNSKNNIIISNYQKNTIHPLNIKKKKMSSDKIKEFKFKNEYLTNKNENKYKQFTLELREIQNKLKFNKPDIKIYKNNMKHITIPPISILNAKLFEKNLKIKEKFKSNLNDKNINISKKSSRNNSKGKKI